MISIFKPIGIMRVFPTLEKNFILPDTFEPPQWTFDSRAFANVVVTINYKSIE